jgi:predicted nucleic acid-binding Zn ribbon protein
MQRITEPALKRCPTCKSKVERMVSRTSFILKGSGWYATDYGRSNKSGGGSNNESSTGDGASAAAKPAESGGSTDKGGADKSAPASSGEKGTAGK